MVVSRLCGCGNTTRITVGAVDYQKFLNKEAPIQKCLPELNEFERETLLSNMCFDCQSKLFNKPKPGEDWGSIMGECESCGAPLYSKDYDSGVCPTCQCGIGDE